MPNLASWILQRDEQWFDPILATRPEINVWNAARQMVALEEMDALLLTGGADISQEYLCQPVPDPSILEEPDLPRDEWEFAARQSRARSRAADPRHLQRACNCSNVALGGTLAARHCRAQSPRRRNRKTCSRCGMTPRPGIALRRSTARITRRSIGWPTVAWWNRGARRMT